MHSDKKDSSSFIFFSPFMVGGGEEGNKGFFLMFTTPNMAVCFFRGGRLYWCHSEKKFKVSSLQHQIDTSKLNLLFIF